MAGGEGRLLEGVGLRFAPEREEVPMANPWRRQHARASSVPATTPLFSRVVTSASGNAYVGKQGGQSAVPEAPNCTKIAEGSERNRCEDGQRKVTGGRGGGRGHGGVRGVLHQLFLDFSWRPPLGVLSLLWVPTASEERPRSLSCSSPSASEAKTGKKGRRGVRLGGVARRNRCLQVIWRGGEGGGRRWASQNGLSWFVKSGVSS